MSLDLSAIAPGNAAALSDADLQAALSTALEVFGRDRQQNQLLYYTPNQPAARAVHASTARVLAAFAGNGAGKTDTMLAELAALATGVLPDSVRAELRPKFRGPIAIRVVLESHVTTLHQIILPKLQWWQWSGQTPHGGDQGHWGWIPKTSLKDANWEKAWSEKLRALTVLCRDPDQPEKMLGYSTFQFMSFEQDASDFASGDFHIVLHDEPPTHAIWRENQARTMRVNGRMLLSMTWPDDPTIAVDWIYDEVYDQAKGRGGDEDVEMVELSTLQNPNLDQVAIAAQMRKWDEGTRLVRIHGQPIRFSNRVHPAFSDLDQDWCFNCGRQTFASSGKCHDCGSDGVARYNHVVAFDVARNWPAVWLLDPHPRKPHMFLWALVDPSDDLWVVADGKVEGDCADVKRACDAVELDLGLNVAARIMDPNMGASPSGQKRGVTWQNEFSDAGLSCDLADDSDVGRGRVNEFLRPDPHRYQPRLHFHPRCADAIYQMKRFTWEDHKRKDEKDQKQKVRRKYDDYPALLRYLMNYNPQFRWLREGAPVIRRQGTRRGAY